MGNNKKPTVLVTGAGGAGSYNIIKALNFVNSYRIIATDIQPWAAGLYISNKGYLVAKDWEKFINDIIHICKKEKVDVLIPGSDIELPYISRSKDNIESTGTKVIIGSSDAIKICNNKWETHNFLLRNKFNTLSTYLLKDKERCLDELKFPIVIKPCSLWGGKGFGIAKDFKEFSYLVEKLNGDEIILQEYIDTPNNEYTAGVTFSKDKELLGSICMWRELIGGASTKMIVDDYYEFCKEVETIASALKTQGPVNIQFRVKDDKLYPFDLNLRFSTTSYIRAVSDFDEIDCLIKNFLYGKKKHLKIKKKLRAILYMDYIFVDNDSFNYLKKKHNTQRKGMLLNEF